ncbi:MAG: hypothetical protein K2M82_05445 [Lachnospiraceae bacterium]|nr:hypothetical protein [Lachnospiraceae bacterium]
MKYCAKCKKLNFTDDEKCTCGKKLKDNPSNDVPIALTTVFTTEKDRIKALLDDNGIPNSVQISSEQTAPTSVPGFETAAYTISVPLGFYKRAVDLLVGTSDIKSPENYDDLPESEEQWEEMSLKKRAFVKFFSAIAFLVLVWLCVAGVDFVVDIIDKLFT